jgi:hypothetical protein
VPTMSAYREEEKNNLRSPQAKDDPQTGQDTRQDETQNVSKTTKKRIYIYIYI